MSIVPRRLLFLTLLFLLLISPASAQVRMPRIDFRDRTLPNGLRVLSIQDRSGTTVAIQVWYHVGSKDDPEGRSGFAHLFEHMMFKSTENMPSEMMDRLTEDIGGFDNAETADDRTVYYEVVPSNYLEPLLWAEAERMATLKVDQPNFVAEREVVKEEYLQSVLAPPYGRFEYLLQQHSFVAHPYKRPTIGSIADLDAASLNDVRSFHSTYYRPDNATIVIAGDFDQKQLEKWIDKYLAGIPRPSAPLPRVNVKEPARTGERRLIEYGTNVPLPAIGITYLTPPLRDKDSDALQVAEIILGEGESSRLSHSLVYEQQIAQSAEAKLTLLEDVSFFVLTSVAASGKKPEAVEKSLLAEVEKLRNTPVSKPELDKAINQILTSELQERETNSGKATALGAAAVLSGDPERVNRDLDRLQAVTAADVQRVMKKYFTAENRLVLYYLSEPEKTNATKHK